MSTSAAPENIPGNTRKRGRLENLENVHFDDNPFVTHAWQKAGGATKEFKGEKNKNILSRQRYYCSARGDLNIKCPATLQVDCFKDSQEQEYILLTDHCSACDAIPHKKVKLAPEVRSAATTMLEGGAAPSNVRNVLSLKAGESAALPRFIPSVTQLRGIAHILKYAELHENAYESIAGLNEGNFLVKLSLFPRVKIMLQTLEQKALADQYGINFIEIDTTYKHIKGGLKLTTMMVEIDGIGFPVAYFIHDLEDADTYRSLWKLYLKRSPSAAPKIVYCDFSKAIHKATRDIIKGVHIHGDRFHFMQSNTKHTKRIAGSELYPQHRKALVTSLRTLYLARTQHELNEALDIFLDYWNTFLPQYTEYFKSTWCESYPPTMWSPSALPNGGISQPHGNIHSESWHNHLRQFLHPVSKEALTLKLFCSKLLDKTKELLTDLQSPALWKQRLHKASVERGKYCLEAVPTTLDWAAQQMQLSPVYRDHIFENFNKVDPKAPIRLFAAKLIAKNVDFRNSLISLTAPLVQKLPIASPPPPSASTADSVTPANHCALSAASSAQPVTLADSSAITLHPDSVTEVRNVSYFFFPLVSLSSLLTSSSCLSLSVPVLTPRSSFFL